MMISVMQTGFTLLEVLIAMLLITLSLLGFAGLQLRALQSNQSAYWHTIAEIAQDRLVEQCYASTNVQRENIIQSWQQNLPQELPQATANIQHDGNRYHITSQWADPAAKQTQTTCPETHLACLQLDLSL